MTLFELESAVGYWHALIIKRMDPVAQGAMFEVLEGRMLEGKVRPTLLHAIQAHFLELIKGSTNA